MFEWLSLYTGTIGVSAVLLAVVAAIVWNLRNQKKQGKSSCGGNCAHCSACGCHPTVQEKQYK